MSEYGITSFKTNQSVVSSTHDNLAILQGGGGLNLAHWSGNAVDFSSLNPTNNVDCVYNADAFMSPFWYCSVPGGGTYYNRFWLDQESPTMPGYAALCSIGIVGVGVGNKRTKTQNHGLTQSNRKGGNVLDTQVKNLKLKLQLLINANTAAITGTAGSAIEGWIWYSNIDLSAIDFEGPNIWMCITPMMGMYMYAASTIYLYANTIFRIVPSTKILTIGDYIKIQSSAMITPIYPARNVNYEVSIFGESQGDSV